MAELNNTSTGKWSETDANNTSASPDGWPSGTFFNQVEPIGRSTMGAIKRFWDRINGIVTTTGSSGAYVYTPTNISYPTAYVTGETYSFIANFTSVGNDTLNVNGLSAKPFYKATSSGLGQLVANDIQIGAHIVAQYDAELNSSSGGFYVVGGLAAGSNSGFLQAVNNLSDVANTATALSNLGGAPLASPAFTGTPTLPTGTVATTQSSADNSTKLATTAFAHSLLGSANVYQASPSNPSATTSTTGKMAGLAGAFTPTGSGDIQITISGNANPSAADFTVQIHTGTGTAPSNGAASAGTAQGNKLNASFTGSVALNWPFTTIAIVTGLTLNTAIWIDLDVLSTSGSVTLTKLNISAFEI